MVGVVGMEEGKGWDSLKLLGGRHPRFPPTGSTQFWVWSVDREHWFIYLWSRARRIQNKLLLSA